MKADSLRSYRFATDAQWNSCLFAQADRDARRATKGIRPFAPYARPGTLSESRGAFAPTVTRTRTILWRDDSGAIHRWLECFDTPETHPAPIAIARAQRMVATSSGLWVMGDAPETLQRYDEETFTRLLTVDLGTTRVVDIANGGHDSLWALIEEPQAERQEESKPLSKAVRVNRSGLPGKSIDFKGISNARSFVFLRRSKKFVVLAGHQHPRLYWFPPEGGDAVFSLAVAAMRPCFTVHVPNPDGVCGRASGPTGVLGSDGNDRIFLAGSDGDEFGGGGYVVIFDADGSSLGDVPLDPRDAPATGITATRDKLFVTGRRGLLQFDVAEVVPEGTGEVSFTLITPMLYSPDREDRRRWLRAEATASLPEGSTLEISWAAIDDLRDHQNLLATDNSNSASHHIATLVNEPDLRRGRTVFRGAPGSDGKTTQATYSAKLFDVTERYLWVFITLTAAAGARLPALHELIVLYPGQTLMQDLPQIYQREEERPDSFLRALVGVMETTTQGLDARIGSMGQQIHPSTATEPWLDYIARWLGVPWDDGLSLEQKKAIVMRAADLAKGRGTRAGLEALLDSLIPGTPRRFRVTDATADFGFAMVGGQLCAGSPLPAMLGGFTRWRSELNSSTVLGYMRLPCAGQLNDGAWQIAGRVRVDVAATAEEREAWQPWLLTLIKEMVPLTAQVELRWITAQALRTNRLDGSMTLESAPAPHLGKDAITNLARLPGGVTRLSPLGPTIGTRLR